MNILVTGGAGFIGSNYLNLSVPRFPQHRFINLDKLTYAANLLNLEAVEALPNYCLEQGDIGDWGCVVRIFEKYRPDQVIHFAAESHVDRSILGPKEFVSTNIIGTFNLLEACRRYWEDLEQKLFLHISTDEVYGSLGERGYFTEQSAYDPSSPYSASKAAGDHLVRAYYRTYGLPAIITNCSNNYGPYQFPEKLVPLVILNALEGKELPVYGQGENVRDWLYVEDHCLALWLVAQKGVPGESYNIGGGNELKNIDLVNRVCELLAEETEEAPLRYKQLIRFVKDRPGHDWRYAIDPGKIKRDLGWAPQVDLTAGLKKTIRWYLSRRRWVESVKTGRYRRWMAQNYEQRCKD